jgi:hypothetical protein
MYEVSHSLILELRFTIRDEIAIGLGSLGTELI